MKPAKKVNSNESTSLMRKALDRIYILSAFDFTGSVHELLHTRNHDEFERAIRLRRLIHSHQALLAPVSRRRHAKFQIRECFQPCPAELRESMRERLDLFQRRRTIDHRA